MAHSKLEAVFCCTSFVVDGAAFTFDGRLLEGRGREEEEWSHIWDVNGVSLGHKSWVPCGGATTAVASLLFYMCY